MFGTLAARGPRRRPRPTPHAADLAAQPGRPPRPAHRRRAFAAVGAHRTTTRSCRPRRVRTGEPGGARPPVRDRPERHGGADGRAHRRQPVERAPDPAIGGATWCRSPPPAGGASTRWLPGRRRPGRPASSRPTAPLVALNAWSDLPPRPLTRRARRRRREPPSARSAGGIGAVARTRPRPSVRRWRRSRAAWRCGRASKPASASTSSVCWPAWAGGARISPGVRLNRGAGPGWVMPATSTNVPRSTLCGCSTASGMASTGAKHTSVPSMSSHHSSRVLVRKMPASRSFSAGHCVAVLLPGQLLALEAGEPQQLGVELRLDRPDRHVPAVGRLVDVVEVGAGVEHVGAPLVVPDAHGPERVGHGHQRRRRRRPWRRR